MQRADQVTLADLVLPDDNDVAARLKIQVLKVGVVADADSGYAHVYPTPSEAPTRSPRTVNRSHSIDALYSHLAAPASRTNARVAVGQTILTFGKYPFRRLEIRLGEGKFQRLPPLFAAGEPAPADGRDHRALATASDPSALRQRVGALEQELRAQHAAPKPVQIERARCSAPKVARRWGAR